MSTVLLVKLIKMFRKGDMSAFTVIYGHYKNLIQIYSKKLCDEDANQELTLFLLELLYNLDTDRFEIDGSNGLSKYIAVCLRNKYISLSKRNGIYTSYLNELFENGIVSDSYYEIPLEFKEAVSFLTQKQRLIIIYKYVYNFSDFEISKILKISRQAVNRIKIRALNELRNYYE